MIEIKQCRYGPMLFLSNDHWVGKSFRLYGEAFERQIAFMLRFIKPDDVVIDGGANMGSMTIPLAQKAGRVLAFEPQEFLYYVLCGNIAANNLYNVSAYMSPLDVTAGRLAYFPGACEFYDQEEHFASASIQRERNSSRDRELSTVAIDRLNLDRLDFIKLDLEGNELPAMYGARKAMQVFKPVMFVEALPDSVEELGNALKYHNYIGHLVQSEYFNPDNHLNNPVDELQNKSHDVICWHEDRDDEFDPIFRTALKECDGVSCLFSYSA